ncbi:MAG: hypothetical protein JWP97_5208 [Labilithrix sp.]|nr:hypothetical protein [Labilithrix sp.]
MRLVRVRLRNVGVFGDTTVRLTKEGPSDGVLEANEGGDAPPGDIAEDLELSSGEPRPVTVLFGADGVGKTTLLTALAGTRPGYALPPAPQPRASDGAAASVVTEWALGDDDPERPHPLVVTSPGHVFEGETPDAAAARRREQALFERKAQSEGGFVFVAFSGARWFSRTASMLTTPERTILRHDVRTPIAFDDPTRADLARETKQILAYAGVAKALAGGRAEHARFERLEAALREIADVMLAPFGFTYSGVSPVSLEPEAVDPAGRVVPFDALPRPARHLVAFGALTLRALHSAYPNADDPRESEGVVAIDDVESQQEPAVLRVLVPLLRRALPNVQWILTTASTQLAMSCTDGEVVALRRDGGRRVEVGEGILH